MTKLELGIVLVVVAGLLVLLVVGMWKAFQKRMALLLHERDELASRWLTERRKREEIFSVVERIQKERDGWRQWFEEASRGHCVAQAALILACENLAKKTKTKINLPEALREAVRAFEEKYGPAAWPKISERIGGQENVLPGEPEPLTSAKAADLADVSTVNDKVRDSSTAARTASSSVPLGAGGDVNDKSQ